MSVNWKYAICVELLLKKGLTHKQIFEKLVAWGYHGLEITPFTLEKLITEASTAELQSLAKLAAEHGIDLCAMHWFYSGVPGVHLTSSDPETRWRTLTYTCKALEACNTLGVVIVVIGSPRQRSFDPEEMDSSTAYLNAIELLKLAAPHAEKHNVDICFEPLGPDETNFGNTMEDCAFLVDSVGSPRVVPHLDVKQLQSEDTQATELITRWGAKAGHFHANGANMLGPSNSGLDFAPIFEALARSGYEGGWVSVESFKEVPDIELQAAEDIVCMRAAEPK